MIVYPTLGHIGFPDSLQMWNEITPRLNQSGYKTIAFDQRGFGESDAPPAVYEYHVVLLQNLLRLYFENQTKQLFCARKFGEALVRSNI